MFEAADVNKDGFLNYGEWVNFYKSYLGHRKDKFGGAYELNEEQVKERHKAFDSNKNGEVSL